MAKKVAAVVLHGKVVAERLNVATDVGERALITMMKSPKRESFVKNTGLLPFLRTGKPSPLHHGKDQVFLEDDGVFRLRSGRILEQTTEDDLGHKLSYMEREEEKEGDEWREQLLDYDVDEDRLPVAVVVDCSRRTTKNRAYKQLLLLNGDQENLNGYGISPLVEYVTWDNPDFPTMSFQAFAQFYPKVSADKAVDYLGQQVKLLDYTPDQWIAMSKAEIKLYRQKKSVKPPKPGFTPVSTKWHRAGTVLLHDTTTNQYFLMGRDEETYYGVELCEACDTIDAAMKSLIPKALHNRCDWTRQGEWFVEPVDEEEVPSQKDAVLLFSTDDTDYSISLPKDTEESNEHTIHSMDGRVSREGAVYAHEGYLKHTQHDDTVEVAKWCTFMRNTAVRSVSFEGVD